MPSSVRHFARKIDGHAVHTLVNAKVSLSIAPEFGARVVSLKDLASGREWLDGWSPAGKRRLHPPRDPANYLTSPLAGIDECLPTIGLGRVAGRDIPDHGETWNTPAPVDPEAAADGVLVSIWSLRCLPLDFVRRITLSGATARFDYALTNRARRPTPFLWAWHPLFACRPGDHVELPAAIRKVVSRGNRVFPWPRARPGCDLSRADLAASGRRTFKGFVGPFFDPRATIHDARGPSLTLRWTASVHPYLGVYVNRGGRHGLSQWAFEPTNARTDDLDRLVADKSPLHWLAPGETREWFVTARVGQARLPT